MRKPTRRGAQAGVTLLELLISVTLLSLLSLGMLFAMRIGLNAMGKTNDRVTNNRRVLGVERILTEEIAGFVTAKGLCATDIQAPPSQFPFFQGDPQTMRFVSTWSLQEAARGYPRILEFQVIPGAESRGVRLIVNETLYTGPLSVGSLCAGIGPPEEGVPTILWRPVVPGPRSFVLADKLARCQFSWKQETEPDKPDLWFSHWPRDYTPSAVRIDWAPLENDPSRIQLPPVTVPFRITRHPFSEYSDQ